MEIENHNKTIKRDSAGTKGKTLFFTLENHMNHDEISKEVRTLRESLVAQHNYNVRTLFEEAKKRQQKSERKVVMLTPRRLETSPEITP